MIEVTILNYLKNALSTPVSMEIPKQQPQSFVVLEKTGSGKRNRLCSATFAVQSYAPSMYEAAELNEAVKAAMESAVALDEVTSVELNSDYNYTDTASKKYRYQAVFEIYHY